MEGKEVAALRVSTLPCADSDSHAKATSSFGLTQVASGTEGGIMG